MPRKRRNPKQRHTEVHDVIRAYFHEERRHTFFYSSAEIAAAWSQIGDEIVDDWIRDKPGTRPTMWWRLSAPEPLLKTEWIKPSALVIPYGTMAQLTNLSRDWVIMKLRVRVPFDTDLEKVRKIFKKVGQQINENPEHAKNLIAPFKSQGAGDVTDVGIVIRGKFTAKPGTQFPIRKEIYSRIQQGFKENGIEFARREVRVRMPDAPADAPLSAETKAAISTAAIAGDAAARG